MNDIKKAIRQINAGIASSDRSTKSITFLAQNNVMAQQTILMNMGIMYSHAGERVVILDTDFQNNSFSNTFGLEKMYGLSDYLGTSSLETKEIVSHVKNTSIDVITSGNSEETEYLIGDPRFDMLLNKLNTQYDRILINTPMFGQIDSIDNLAKVTDGFILLVNIGSTKKSELLDMMKILKNNRSKIIGYINVEKD